MCGHRFQYKKRTAVRNENIWKDYVHGKQTLTELGEKHGKSVPTIRAYLDTQTLQKPKDIPPCPTVIIADTTFWGRTYGVVVFRSSDLKRNLWWNEVSSEKQAHYFYGRKILEDKGWTFTAAVVDGRRGLTTVFKDIPVQICQFHQIKTITTYLTRKPKTDAGRELRKIALTLPRTDEKTFTEVLCAWEKRWHTFYMEKTHVTGTKHWYYTHKNVYSAYMSLKHNLPHLFTYLRYPELKIPNTTNSIDGSFSSLKQKVAAHHGLRRDRRYKMISELLRGKGKTSS